MLYILYYNSGHKCSLQKKGKNNTSFATMNLQKLKFNRKKNKMPKDKAYIMEKFNLLNRMLIPLRCKDTN